MLTITALETYTSPKIKSIEELAPLVERWKAEGKKVGMCHGCFDLVHPGHIRHFAAAKKECDILIVSTNIDQFITTQKGPGKPIYPAPIRAYAIANLATVDYVVLCPFQTAVEIINKLNPSLYIRGPDYLNKMTPGLALEKVAVEAVGGKMILTTEPNMSTSNIIKYIKRDVIDEHILIILDRDGTIIDNAHFLGRNKDWVKEIRFNQTLLDYLLFLQSRYRTTKIGVTNQAGVAQKMFTSSVVEEINQYVSSHLLSLGVVIDNWQYCPDVDHAYVQRKLDTIFDHAFVKEKSKRKPNPAMVYDGLAALQSKLGDYFKVIVIGDDDVDRGLAVNLQAQFIDIREKTIEQLMKEFS